MPFISRRHSVLATAALAALSFTGLAHAQAKAPADWPKQPIKVVVPYTPGGSTDVVSRTIFDAVSRRLGQPIVIENKPGANSTVGTAGAARAKADGYNFVSVLAAYTVNQSLYPKLPYKPTDFVAVSHMADLPLFLFVSNKVPVKTVAELAAYGKTNPLTYASSGTGASAHMTGARFAMEAKIDATHVPYQGSAPILADLLNGNVSMVFDPILVPMPHVKQGKLKALAVTSTKRWPGEPNIPTMIEAGFPGFAMNSWVGLLAPKGTPQPIVERMSKEIAEVVRTPEVQKKLESLGFEGIGSNPAQFQQLIDKDVASYRKIIQTAKIKLD